MVRIAADKKRFSRNTSPPVVPTWDLVDTSTVHGTKKVQPTQRYVPCHAFAEHRSSAKQQLTSVSSDWIAEIAEVIAVPLPSSSTITVLL